MNPLPNPFALFNKKMEKEEKKEKKEKKDKEDTDNIREGIEGTVTVNKSPGLASIPFVLFICFIVMAFGYYVINTQVILNIETSIPTASLRIGFAFLTFILWGVFIGSNIISEPTPSTEFFSRTGLAYTGVVLTFLLLETPPGQWLINKLENRFGIMMLSLLSYPLFPEFTNLKRQFKSTLFPDIYNNGVGAETHEFPLEYILPMIDLNNGIFKYKDGDNNGLFLEEIPPVHPQPRVPPPRAFVLKGLFDKYNVKLDIGGSRNSKQNVNDLFKLCLYKYSIGHFIIVYISLISATLGASIVF